jgi:hypothetical protein
MPKFIKNNTIITVSKTGFETEKRVLFTDREIFERIKENPSLIFEVTESHAAGVLRPQQKYQEINPHMLQIIEEDAAAALLPPLTPAEQKKLDSSNAKNEAKLKADAAAAEESALNDDEPTQEEDLTDDAPSLGKFGG